MRNTTIHQLNRQIKDILLSIEIFLLFETNRIHWISYEIQFISSFSADLTKATAVYINNMTQNKTFNKSIDLCISSFREDEPI